MTQNIAQKKQSKPLNTLPSLKDIHAKALLIILHEYQKNLTLTFEHLEAERKSIAERDYQKLQDTLGKKDQALSKVSKLETQLFQILRAYNITHQEPQKILGLIQDHTGPNQLELEKTWYETTELLKKCSWLNLVNGKVISHSKSYLSRLISILKGIDQNTETYKRDGQPQVDPGYRILAKV